MSRAQLNRNLLERTLDIAFSFDPLKSDELMSKEIARMTLALVSTQRSDVTSALSNQYVYIDWGTRFASEHALRHQQMPAPYLRTSTGRIALDFILDNTGAAYLPVSMVSPLLTSTQLYSVEGAELWLRPIFINYRKDSVSFEAIAKIEGLLQEMFPQL